MGKTIISSREFNRDVSGAKRAASNGPVIITDRARPAHGSHRPAGRSKLMFVLDTNVV